MLQFAFVSASYGLSQKPRPMEAHTGSHSKKVRIRINIYFLGTRMEEVRKRGEESVVGNWGRFDEQVWTGR